MATAPAALARACSPSCSAASWAWAASPLPRSSAIRRAASSAVVAARSAASARSRAARVVAAYAARSRAACRNVSRATSGGRTVQSGATSTVPAGTRARTSASRPTVCDSSARQRPRSSAPSRRAWASHDSMSVNRDTSKRRSSTSRRCSALARRNAANSPCGRSATLANCSNPRPSTSRTIIPTSWAPVATGTQSVVANSSIVTVAGTVVSPLPRRLGRWCSGLRRSRKRRPAAVNSSSTDGTLARSAWSLRNERPLGREPGTPAYSAKQMASSRLVLPAPVGPCTRKIPPAPTVSRSTSTRPANGPNASTTNRCSLTRPPGPGPTRPRRRARPGARASLRPPRRAPRTRPGRVRRRRGRG